MTLLSVLRVMVAGVTVVGMINMGVSGAAVSCEPEEYYSTITALNSGPPTNRNEWQQLYTSLHALLVQTHVVIPYTSDDTDVWDALRVVDQDPNNDQNVWLLYANRTEPFITHGDNDGWNREHVIPRSYGLFDNGPDYSDVHNLRASDATVNSARGNLYFDNCEPSVDSTCTRPAHVEAAPDTAKNSFQFYPSAYRKGDIARGVFYMALRYNGTGGENGESNTEQLRLTDCPCLDTHAFGKLTTLLEWAREDEVDATELTRNNLTCSLFQRNRNPFVDYPWLIGLFELSPGLPDLYQDCSVNYTGDPNNCGHTVDVGTDAPSVSPDIHTPSPTTVADANSVGVGGIAVIALNSENPDSFALVALEGIRAGTVVRVTDNGWTSTGFRGGEGEITFPVDTDIPAGTVWTYDTGNTASNSNAFGSWNPDDQFALSTNGDQIFVYTGSYSNPSFIYGVSNTWNDATTSSTNTLLPDQLANTFAYVTIGSYDNAKYSLVMEGTKEQLLKFISYQSSWEYSSSLRFDVHSISDFIVTSSDDGNVISKSGVIAIVLVCLLICLAVMWCIFTGIRNQYLKKSVKKFGEKLEDDNL